MSPSKRRSVAKGILLVYVVIASTFELAHTDYVPLAGRLVFSSFDSADHSLANKNDGFACPAHQFAQSTHSASVRTDFFLPSGNFSFARIEFLAQCDSAPLRLATTRGPPVA